MTMTRSDFPKDLRGPRKKPKEVIRMAGKGKKGGKGGKGRPC